MAGVQQDVKDAAAAVAKAKGLPAGTYAIRNTRSAVEPVLSFGTNRACARSVEGVRQPRRQWQCQRHQRDHRQDREAARRPRQAARLREPRRWRMQDTMAKSPDKAMDLMMRVWKPAVERVNEEVADMKPFAAKDGVTTIEPWDYRYYQEKVRKAKYDLSEDEIKPYFELDEPGEGHVLVGRPALRPEVQGKHRHGAGVPSGRPHLRGDQRQDRRGVGLFYLDTYAREGKRSGAWVNTYRSRAGCSATTSCWLEQQQFHQARAGQAGADQPR